MINEFLTKHFPNQSFKMTAIEGGTTSKQTYIITVQDRSYILQVLDKLTGYQHELQCSLIAAKQQIGAEIITYQDNMVLYHAWPFAGLRYQQLADKKMLTRVIEHLRLQHQINTIDVPPALNLIQRCQQYQPPEFIDNKNIERIFQQYIQNEEPVFIHGDLNHSNIVYCDDDIRFIDWHTAGMGCRYDDLAEIAVYFHPPQFNQILDVYFKNQTTQDEKDRLYYAWLGRLYLFACWALHRANTIFDYQQPLQDFQSKPVTNITQHLQTLADGKNQLDNGEKLYDFAISALQQLNSENHLRH